MPMYNLLEHSKNYSKTSSSLWQYFKDEPSDPVTDSESAKFKNKFTGSTTDSGGTKNVKIIVPLKYLSNFWRTLGLSLTNWEFKLILSWYKNCVIIDTTALSAGNDPVANSAIYAPTGAEPTTTDRKLYVPVVKLTNLDNIKLLKELESGFKRSISWIRYITKRYLQNNSNEFN